MESHAAVVITALSFLQIVSVDLCEGLHIVSDV